jgi:TfoX/Sxy family transcriptional regulator of competence genes
MFGSLWLYLGGLLLALVAINVLLIRTIRAEKRRQAEERTRNRSRH